MDEFGIYCPAKAKNTKASKYNKIRDEILSKIDNSFDASKIHEMKEEQTIVDTMVYKDHMVRELKRKSVEKQKREAECEYGLGGARYAEGMFDHFILTRKLNFPELIFNKDRESKDDPYFDESS